MLLNISGSSGKEKENKRKSSSNITELYGGQIRFPCGLAGRALVRAFPQEVGITLGILEYTPMWPAVTIRL